MPVFPLKMHRVAFCTFLAISCLSAFTTGRVTSSAQLEQQQQQWVATHGAITSVPGYEGQLPSKHYGGYITVGNKQLYYYMVESERSPATDPVV
jgi:carboxypeptidase C (cathepsin A)